MNWGFLAWGSRMYLNRALFQKRGSTKRPVISTNFSKRPVTSPPLKESKRPGTQRGWEILASHSPEEGGAELLPGDPAALSRSPAEPCWLSPRGARKRPSVNKAVCGRSSSCPGRAVQPKGGGGGMLWMNPEPAPKLYIRPAPRGFSLSDWPPAPLDWQRDSLSALIGPLRKKRQYI